MWSLPASTGLWSLVTSDVIAVATEWSQLAISLRSLCRMAQRPYVNISLKHGLITGGFEVTRL
jgi:hypothetical protein